MTPTHTMKSGRRHRYYISHRLLSGGRDPSAWRLPAGKLETIVADIIANHLEAAARHHRLLASPDLRAGPGIESAVPRLVQQLRSANGDVLKGLLISGAIGSHSLALTLDHDYLAEALAVPATDLADDIDQIASGFQLRRRGVEARLIVGERTASHDPVLLRTLRDAHRWAGDLRNGVPLQDIARKAGHHEVYIRTRSPVAFLSPRIQQAIADGTLPPEVTLQSLVTRTLPLDWADQERLCRLT